MRPAVHGRLLVLGEQLAGALGELAGQTAVASLVHEEVLVLALDRLLGVDDELLARSALGIEAVELPIAALHGLLHLVLRAAHAPLDMLLQAGAVADDDGRAVVLLRLPEGLEGLGLVRAHGHLGHVHIAVAHGDLGEALLLHILAGSGELRHLAEVGSLGGLAAGVGVHLGVEHEHVHVLAGGEHVIESAVSDIVGPAVAAEDPHRLLGQVLLVGKDARRELGHLSGALGSSAQSLDVGRSRSLGGFSVSAGLKPGARRVGQLAGRTAALDEGLGVYNHLVLHGLVAQKHAHAVLGVVLKQRVRPGRAVAVGVHRVGRRSRRTAPDGRAARGVGDVHTIAEQLGDQARVRGLGAAGTRAGELQQRALELAGLHRGALKLGLAGDLVHAVVEHRLLVQLVSDGHHRQRVGRALDDAQAAAHAIERRDGQHVLHVGAHLALHGDVLGLGRGRCHLGVGQRERADGGVRAHKRALVALDAGVGAPLGHRHGHAALLVGRGAQRELAVLVADEGGHGQRVAVHASHRLHDALDKGHGLGTALDIGGLGSSRGALPRLGHVHLHESGGAGIDGLVVHVNDVLALLGVGSRGRILHVLDGLFLGHDLGQGEEGGLQDGVGALAHADLDGQVDGVDEVELDVVVGDVALGVGGQVLFKLLGRPLAVDEEAAAGLHVAHDREVLGDVGGVVAGHEVGLVHVVGAADGAVAETQVRDGHAAGLLRVVLEVGLDILVGVIADDLDGVLVRAHGAIAAKAPELALDGALGRSVGRREPRAATDSSRRRRCRW